MAAEKVGRVQALKEACDGAEAELLARLRAAEQRAAQSNSEAAETAAQLQSVQGEVQDLQQRVAVEAQSRVEREGAIERVNASLAEAHKEVEEKKEAAQAEKARAEALRAKLVRKRGGEVARWAVADTTICASVPRWLCGWSGGGEAGKL